MNEEEILKKIANAIAGWKGTAPLIIISCAILTIVSLSYLIWLLGSWDDFHRCCCNDNNYFKGTEEKYNVTSLYREHKIWTAEEDCCAVCEQLGMENTFCTMVEKINNTPAFTNVSDFLN